MLEFIINSFLWIFALYGVYEIIKNILYIKAFTECKPNGTYFIVATKNQEEQIEGFIRTLVFRILYGKEDIVKSIIIADLDSTDNTKAILKNLEKDYDFIKVFDWKDCKELLTNIQEIGVK